MRVGRKVWYANVLDIPAGTSGKVSVTHDVTPPGATLWTASLRTMMFGQEGESLVFPTETRWHRLSEEGEGTWMTDLPIEQHQMDSLASKATGRVLVGGLGLGYAVVALAAKKRVHEIVVVERSPDVIALVEGPTRAMLARMGSDVSVTIVQADLFDYLQQPDLGRFTWALYDVWQADGEHTFHTMVVPLRAASAGLVRRVVCWNEDVMRGQLLNGLVTRRMLLKQPALFGPTGTGVSLDMLAEPRGDIYHDWAVPFWVWVRDHAPQYSDQVVDYVLSTYVQEYGRPERQNGLRVLKAHTPPATRRRRVAVLA